MRRLHHESLESRRLLAAEVGFDLSPGSWEGVHLEGENPWAIIRHVQENTTYGSVSSIPFYDGLVRGVDLIHEQDNRLFVVDQLPFAQETATLHVFERTADGGLESITEVDLSFSVREIEVVGDQVLLYSSPRFDWLVDPFIDDALLRPERDAEFNGPRTIVATINVGEEIGVVVQEFEGHYHQFHYEDGRVTMLGTNFGDPVIAIYPPPPIMGTARSFELTDSGLVEISQVDLPAVGISQIDGDAIYSAYTERHEIHYLVPPGQEKTADDHGEPNAFRAPDPDDPWYAPTTNVAKYVVADDGQLQTEVLELGSGAVSHFQVADDGQTAIVIRNEYAAAGPAKLVDLIQISSDGAMSVFETIRLDEFSGPAIMLGPEYVVLQNFENNSLIVIDANQDIDLAAESRVSEIALPVGTRIAGESLQLGDNVLVLQGQRSLPNHPTTTDDGDAVNSAGRSLRLPLTSEETTLLSVSVSEATVIGETTIGTHDPWIPPVKLFLIDAESSRFGYVTSHYGRLDKSEEFVFGGLDDDGRFVAEGSAPIQRWLEIDANADRLIARTSDSLIQYDWENVDEPVETPLGDPDPSVEAVDDHYTLVDNDHDHVLNVLANDVVHWPFGGAEIVSLGDAPEGIEIVGGHSIRVPASVLEGAESLRFEYTVTDGRNESTAVVEIEVLSIRDEQVDAIVQAIREQAAEDFDAGVDDVQIKTIEKIFGQPLPVVLPDGVELDLSPGVLVTLDAPGATALYAASLDGQIIQVFASRRESLVELGLRAVSENGETLREVTSGQEFWLEFNAKDLRLGGQGVYAAFFDLVVPTENLVITGPVEYGEGFTSQHGGEFTEGEIDELGAISEEIHGQGNERQMLLRIAVKATGAGTVTLTPNATEGVGTEALLRGRNTEVPASSVRYRSLELTVIDEVEETLDANGNGEVTTSDALVVINFLEQFGAISVDELATLIPSADRQGENSGDTELDQMRRLDTNRSGTITALDALIVLNRVGEIVDQQFQSSNSASDDVDETDEPASTIQAASEKIVVVSQLDQVQPKVSGCVCGGVGCSLCNSDDTQSNDDENLPIG